jgi:predicted O-methyltransferase YrrM
MIDAGQAQEDQVVSRTTRLRGKLREKTRNVFLPRGLTVRLLEHLEPADYLDEWSAQPFNGQVHRFALIVALAREIKPTIAVETGTYLGTSTPYLAALAERGAITIEISDHFAERARRRFAANHADAQIVQLLGDSVERIRQVLDGLDPHSDRVLAYLDAHWQDSVPTSAELAALADWGGTWVAVVDDFEVPGDPGYGFDAYGATVVGLDLVPDRPDLVAFVPSVPSAAETGARRGTGVVMPPSVLASLSPAVTDLLHRAR